MFLGDNVVTKEEFLQKLPRKEEPTLERRGDSFRSLLHDITLRKRFCDEFLVDVFNVADVPTLSRMMSKAAWDPHNQNDLDIYGHLVDQMHTTSNLATKLLEGVRAVRQLSRQKAEITEQTGSILHRLGKLGRIRSYISVGDNGKVVQSFRRAGFFDESEEIEIIIVHDFDGNDNQMSTILERGSLEPVGNVTVQFDYVKDEASSTLSCIKSDSVDLVTLNQGLHHFPVRRLYDFLIEIRRVLRDDGIFVLREHNLRLSEESGCISTTSAPVAMLDLAHSVFNVVTGVSKEKEAHEIRAFRPLVEWRTIMLLVGFEDCMLYGVGPGDTTYDFMVCFRKLGTSMTRQCTSPLLSTRSTNLNQPELPMMMVVKNLLAQIPSTVVGNLSHFITECVSKLPQIIRAVSTFFRVEVSSALLMDVKRRKNKATLAIPDKLFQALTSFIDTLAEVVTGQLEKMLQIGTGAQALLQLITIRETSNIAGLLSTPEFWLILPSLKRQKDADPHSIGELETFVLEFVESNLPFLFELDPSASSDIEREPTAKKAKDATIHDKPSAVADNFVDTREVLDTMLKLAETIQGLSDPSVSLIESDFTLSQQSAIFSALAAPDLPGLAENIAYYHDGKSWESLRRLLIGDGDSVLARRELPTKERLFSREINHPWHRALKAFIAGPRVQLKTQAKFGLRLVGLSELNELYDETKNEIAQKDKDTDSVVSLSEEETMILKCRFARVCQPATLKEVTYQFNETTEHNLFDVAEVVSARYGYMSITSRLTDVTQDLKVFHEDLQSEFASNQPAESLVGWLPIRKCTLDSFRNKDSVSKLGDSMRQAVVLTSTLGLKGGTVLKLKYIPLVAPVDSNGVHDLCAFACDKRILHPNLHKNNGYFTWFKLAEWMQVEIMEIFTKSLDHTPWFHFPFMGFLSTYFRVLFQECRVVAEEHGLVEAYGSMAFATDLIPGIVMSILFGQLQLLAYPLKLYLPGYDPEVMTEELVMIASSFPSNNLLLNLQGTIDSRIQDAVCLCRPGDSPCGLYKLVVPTYKAMSEILIKIGERHLSAQVLRISNQSVIQACLVVNLAEPITVKESQDYVRSLVTQIDSMLGLEVKFQYNYPMHVYMLRQQGELDCRTVHLAVRADIPHLLNLVRLVTRHERVQIKQIYDFFSG